MRWSYCKKEDYIGIICTDQYKSKYQLYVSPNTKFDKNYIGEQDVDMRYLLIKTNNIPILKDIKKEILSLQKEYDKSAEVNSFTINGRRAWLDKATRVGLINSITTEKNKGLTNTTLWFDKICINVDIDKAFDILNDIEMYAIACNNNTRKHLAEISNIATLEDLIAYDITADYPKQLEIEIDDYGETKSTNN